MILFQPASDSSSGSSASRIFVRSPFAFWLGISLLFTLYYGLVTIAYAFSHPYLVQDDVRQHVVWMQRFTDPELFPNDWIANYFQSVAPLGFKAVFAAAAKLGLPALTFVKILPLLLSLGTTVYLFLIFLELFPSPFGAFLSTLITNQLLWLNDDLVSGTPRAFVYPIFTAFLYYLLRRSLLPCILALGLQGLFFPHLMLVGVGVLTVALVKWRGNRIRLSQDRRDYLFWAAGLGVALLVILPFSQAMDSLGNPLTYDLMRSMPEHGRMGRNEYFGVPPLNFWFNGRSGIRLQLFPSLSLVGLALPLLGRFPRRSLRESRFAAMQHLTPKVRVLVDVVLASMGWFMLAHLFLPRLYLPSRYNYHSFRIVLPLSAAIVFTVLISQFWQTFGPKLRGEVPLAKGDRTLIGLLGCLAAVVTLVPLVPPLIYVLQNWQIAQTPAIHQFLVEQPKSALVASLADEADNVPAFALRSTLVGREFALAYHPDYYQEIQNRAIALLQLQYSPNPQTVQQVIQNYGIDWIWIEDAAFQPEYLRQKDWLVHSSFKSAVDEAIATLEQGKTPAIVPLLDRCTAVRAGRSRLIDAACVDVRSVVAR
ncbi:hypothetical protein [Leptolyngbya sp. O-77]|uniref:hypothetical protein n=1 Tax=Leptolyngbya sp. O-77 TaxID=1080068 RepID=UPI00074D499C|nr:hypothetical protein [Leptolyngbya sp. O-77]BAU44208.1 hypothetical protein O77CONTIG1_04047 [Leptolyngbya sp. O-77]